MLSPESELTCVDFLWAGNISATISLLFKFYINMALRSETGGFYLCQIAYVDLCVPILPTCGSAWAASVVEEDTTHWTFTVSFLAEALFTAASGPGLRVRDWEAGDG